ncbi:DNA methyltransferase [Limosilactobacillus mucosae]|uniref:DNA methyltransferase n=1 Tax=Limosilactobacillus mucosae TaxID=97478 RepID=UPI004039FE9C
MKRGVEATEAKTRQQLAKEFVDTWTQPDKGKEDADRQTFWNDLLHRVYGIVNYYDYVTYEKDVRVKDSMGKITTKRIDGYIPSTRTMIEQKGRGRALDKPEPQSDGVMLTPYEQAKRYANFLPNSEQPRWIIVSNFDQIDIHDMDHPLDEPKTIMLTELPKHFKDLEFMVDIHKQQIINEEQVSFKAGELVAKIYNELAKAYAEHADLSDTHIQRSLNVLIVRLVFLLYVDDTQLFGNEDMFQAFLERREPRDIRRDLISLFEVLNTPLNERDPFMDEEFAAFPYVNGGMFANEDIVVPQFTQELRDLILDDASRGFNWSGISPTIFGAVFESTLNPETRRSGGMHYTSVENIHKVIDPLFLNDLRSELNKIQNMSVASQRKEAAEKFRDKIGHLKFFDPACGSGNFLTETYLSLRHMEDEVIRIIQGENTSLLLGGFKVSITNFYGIEINDFAVSVAKTAMWIAEAQTMQHSQNIGVYTDKDFFPLTTNTGIHEGNALRMDWTQIVKPYECNYVMGNPPFIGYSYQSKDQKQDIKNLYLDENGKALKYSGKIDYVSGWYHKACQYINGTTIKVAFVSTNSITQGEQVQYVWESLISQYHISINFAYRTFVWDNEAKNKAHVHVVIIGFSQVNSENKFLVDENGNKHQVAQINPYLIPLKNIFIEKHSKPIQNVPIMVSGNRPADGGHLILSQEEADKLIDTEPKAKKYIKRFMMGNEFLNDIPRYCLWLVGISPKELRSMPLVLKHVEKCRENRLSGAADRQKLAATPHLFRETRNPDNFIAIPVVSSERRAYIPMDYLSSDVIAGNKLFILPDATKYDFGILESIVHMSWMRMVAGRLETRYSYSKTLVYNDFSWPNVNKMQRDRITETAQSILDARKLYPDSSLADLYDPLTMPIELRKAHEANDKAVLQAYGLKPSATEAEIVQHLFKMYEKLTAKDDK